MCNEQSSNMTTVEVEAKNIPLSSCLHAQHYIPRHNFIINENKPYDTKCGQSQDKCHIVHFNVMGSVQGHRSQATRYRRQERKVTEIILFFGQFSSAPMLSRYKHYIQKVGYHVNSRQQV